MIGQHRPATDQRGAVLGVGGRPGAGRDTDRDSGDGAAYGGQRRGGEFGQGDGQAGVVGADSGAVQTDLHYGSPRYHDEVPAQGDGDAAGASADQKSERTLGRGSATPS